MTTGKDVARKLTGRPLGGMTMVGLQKVISTRDIIDILRKNIRDEAEAIRDYTQQARAIREFVYRMAPGDPRRERMIHLEDTLDRISREEKYHLRQFTETLSLISPADWHKAEDEIVAITGLSETDMYR